MRKPLAILCSVALALALPLTIHPAKAQFTGPIYCNAQTINATVISTATTTSLLAVPSGTARTFICGYSFYGGATAATMTLQLEYGTGATCSSPTVLTPAVPVAASTIVGDNSAFFRGLVVPANNGLCVVSAGGTVSAFVQVFYAQQ